MTTRPLFIVALSVLASGCHHAHSDSVDGMFVTDGFTDDLSGDGAASGDAATSHWTAATGVPAVSYHAAWGSSADDVYVVGDQGVILHTSDHGATYTVRRSATSGGYPCFAIWGSGPNDIYVVGAPSSTLHSTDGGFTWNVEALTAASGQMNGIAGTGPNDLVAVGSVTETGTGGGHWMSTPLSQDQSIVATRVVMANGNAYAVGLQTVSSQESKGYFALSTDHQHFTSFDTGAPILTALWATDATNVFAAGADGYILHAATTGGWTVQRPTTSGDAQLLALGGALDDLYAAGQGGALLQSSDGGTTWTVRPSPTTNDIEGVWYAGPGDVYLVGDGGTILHGG